MYSVQLLPPAERDLSRLDLPVQRRIRQRLAWVAEHFDSIQPEPLTGPLGGRYKLRVGDYRVLYQFDRTARTITVFKIRHRREVYE